jgi:hypothetical protein
MFPVRCPRKGCTHRFSELDLPLHLSCHVSDTSAAAVTSFRCPKCPSAATGTGTTTFPKWRRLSMHLWREHRIDTGLVSCVVCKEYKTCVPSAMENHMLVHAQEKKFRCVRVALFFLFAGQLGGDSPLSKWRVHMLKGLVRTAVSVHLQRFGE